jgi:hypothetical protein
MRCGRISTVGESVVTVKWLAAWLLTRYSSNELQPAPLARHPAVVLVTHQPQ